MKAVVLTGHGGPEVLKVEERPDPPVGAGRGPDRRQGRGHQLRRHDGAGRALSRRAEAALRPRLRGRGRGRVGGGGRDRVQARRPRRRRHPLRRPGLDGLACPRTRCCRWPTGSASSRARPSRSTTRPPTRPGRHGRPQGGRPGADPRRGRRRRDGRGADRANAAGAEVFGTASASKHDAIRKLGVEHAIDYRTQDFEQEVMRITDGRGRGRGLRRAGAEELPQGLPGPAPGRAADHVRARRGLRRRRAAASRS